MTAPQDPFSKRPEQAGGVPSYPSSTPPGEPQGYGPPAYGPPAGYGGTAGYGPAAGGGWGAPGSDRPALASWGLRAAGYLVDLAIVLVVTIVLSLISGGLARIGQLGLGLYFGYLTGTTGQTPGRRVVGITVRRESDGQFLGAGAGIGRGFLHIVDALPLLLGYFWPIWDAKKQTFADKIIGSVVVRA